MVAADKATISVGRAQDWINTVINPIVDGIRRERRALPDGPWRWQPTTRSFEFFLPAKEYVPHPYLDNYDDFIEKYRGVGEDLSVHDGRLAAFAKEFERAFDVLSVDTGSFMNEVDSAAVSRGRHTAPNAAREWFVSYVAGNFGRLPDYYVGHERYNAHADRLLEAARGVLKQAKIDVPGVARQLADHDAKLEKQLVELRRDLADHYGARVRPS